MLKVNSIELNSCLLWRFKVLNPPTTALLNVLCFSNWLVVVVVCLFSCSRSLNTSLSLDFGGIPTLSFFLAHIYFLFVVRIWKLCHVLEGYWTSGYCWLCFLVGWLAVVSEWSAWLGDLELLLKGLYLIICGCFKPKFLSRSEGLLRGNCWWRV